MTISKETLGLAGEYAVAAEFCRRGVYCQLTLGNRKKTDLLVDTTDSFFRVSVKAKQGRTWPKISGIWQEGDLLVFVDYMNKDTSLAPDFYVLDVAAWKKVVTRIKKRPKNSNAKINKENTLHWPASDVFKGWAGCAVSIMDISEFKDAWPNF